MSRCEKCATIVTSNRPLDDCATLLGDDVVVTPLLNRLMPHGHLLKSDGKSRRLKGSAARFAKRRQSSLKSFRPAPQVGPFDPIVSADYFAEDVGVASRTVRRWADDGMPVYSKGRYDIRACLPWIVT